MAAAKKRGAVKKTAAARKTRTARTPRPPALPDLATMLAELTVETAVRRDLADLAKRDRDLATSALAANALQLAREMDSKNSATSKSMCARALNETMEKLRELAPPPADPDAVDELLERRAARLAKAVKPAKKRAAKA